MDSLDIRQNHVPPLAVHLLDFLCDHADIGCVPAVIAEAIKPSPSPRRPRDDVVLKSDIGTPSATAPASAPAATAVTTAAAMSPTAANAAAMAATACSGAMATTADGSAMTAAARWPPPRSAMTAAPSGAMTGVRTPVSPRRRHHLPYVARVSSLAVSGVVAFATITACRTSARTITQIAATQVAAITAGIENLLAVAVRGNLALRDDRRDCLRRACARHARRGSNCRRRYLPPPPGRFIVILCLAPIDTAAPVAARRPSSESISGAEGDAGRDDAGGDIARLWPIIGRIGRIGPRSVDDGWVVIRHIHRSGSVGAMATTCLPPITDGDALLLRRLQCVIGLRFGAQTLNGVHHVWLLRDDRITQLLGPIELRAHHFKYAWRRHQRFNAVVPILLGDGGLERIARELLVGLYQRSACTTSRGKVDAIRTCERRLSG